MGRVLDLAEEYRSILATEESPLNLIIVVFGRSPKQECS